ncbi:2-succinyl-6-hydroxy-2,4-cyclohexadiene-1-carboxylate synthase [Photobacterium makurazakiensis]|uniref:2-succinyl-6-hydroxy-2, 4-cyclohexadiene-1-carboxylate synthase n=1 Tax=Photobacterium makurazakiensis TaxID=2910234 RepID=UPI003D0B31BA
MLLYSETFGFRASVKQSHRKSCSNERPTLVFLHGLLGTGRDWRDVINLLAPNYPCLTIDLPGHGHSQLLNAKSFDDVSLWLQQTLVHRGITDYVLVGYSLGARLAMYYACQQHAVQPSSAATPQPILRGLVLEGGNFGLPESEREKRWENDKAWANRFASESIGDVLADWYQQPVFSSLNYDQRQSLIQKRSDNLSGAIARMLQATSLAHQPMLQAQLADLIVPIHYVCGAKDEKFKCLAEQSGLDYSVIPEAGHNVHAEQPYGFFMATKQYLLQNLIDSEYIY